MAIKLKNKLAIVGWILLFTYGLLGTCTVFTGFQRFREPNYFQTDQFQSWFDPFIQFLSVTELNDFSSVELRANVASDDINDYRYYYGDRETQTNNIRSQYAGKIEQAKADKNEQLEQKYIAERDRKIEDITQNFESDYYVKQKIVKSIDTQIENYRSAVSDQYRESMNEWLSIFDYSLQDMETKEVFTDLSSEDNESSESDQKQQKALYQKQFTASAPLDTGRYIDPFGASLTVQEQAEPVLPDGISPESASRVMSESAHRFTGQISIPGNLSADSFIMQEYTAYRTTQWMFYLFTVTGVAALILSFYMINRKKQMIRAAVPEEWATPYKRIPVDIRLFVLYVSLILLIQPLLSIGVPFLSQYGAWDLAEDVATRFVYASIFVLILVVQVALLTNSGASIFRKAVWQKSLAARVFNGFRIAFSNLGILMQALILLGTVFLTGAALPIALDAFGYARTFLFAGPAGLLMLTWIVNRVGYFNRIAAQASAAARGQLENDLPVKGHATLARLAGDINRLKNGVRSSQKARDKSERLRTELITNVSHDLRTPLTSVMTYTELLKKKGISEEERDSYIQIIDRKSRRLKHLIDDLFEATKMASGNVSLNKERVDLVELLQQALAEYDEAIHASTLTFKVEKPDQPVYATVDGPKIWRVFDNLIGNILKYSLEQTRVYIQLEKKAGRAIICFKNITKYDLGGNVDELFERFKRGDASRHTEGSGLGLAIAKSIVDLHEGDFDLQLDGDLFKVTLRLNT